jgi:MurNAc alpha-1-phosphate uridylyltransferase
LLGTEPFLVVNADIICAYPLALLRGQTIDLAHLVLTANPPHHPEGDFGVAADGRLSLHVSPKFTYSGVGVFQPRLFYNLPSGPLKLRPVLNRAIQAGRISGEVYTGLWMDIGTPQRLSEVDGLLREGQIRR